MRKWIALLLAAALMAVSAACALEESADEGGDDEAARAEVAVTVGGKYDITKGEIIDQYEYLVSMYEYYGMSAPTADADIETMQDSAVEGLVLSKLLLYKAEEAGIALSEEQIAEVEAQVEEEMQYWIESFAAQAESEGAEDVDARTEELFNEALVQSGMDMDMEGYRAYMRGMIEDEAMASALEESIKATVSITEEEVESYYDNLLEIQKADYDETPANYRTDKETFEMNGGNPVVYAPEGYMRVKTITVSPTEEVSEEYTTLRSELDALEAEFGALSLEDEAGNAARIAEIRTEYAEKKTEADALYEDYIQAAREKINAAYAALQAGESFEAVLEEYGEDDMYTTYPSFLEKGILMLKEGETQMDAELVEAVLALESGQYSEIIQLGDMFYIVMPVGDEPAGTTPLEDVYETVEEMARAEKAETFWNEQQESWGNDTELVVYHEDVYRDIGK
ncbi:MAG: peptidyl-prolyl cis-trans isomerase [Clostridia bacterium]|nr:peptidyl-prolyl cis-trans isomerase [Clostridia bacterium]